MWHEPHNFADSLALSKSQSDAPWWLDVYREAFPDLHAAVYVQDDGWANAWINRR